MDTLETLIPSYIEFCKCQKMLDEKTLKAYSIDLKQFQKSIPASSVLQITPCTIESFISMLHQEYKPKTAKRKISSVKAFFHYLECKDIVKINPMNKVQTKFRKPVTLPKIIPLHTIETFLSVMYKQKKLARSKYQKKCILRDIAVIELLFSTGMRISELCSLKQQDIDLYEKNILIYGKGAKERKIQIGNDDVVSILSEYQKVCTNDIQNCGYFFTNRLQKRLSEQSVRDMINKYSSLAAIDMHITPHMFRHSFATYLLEADVDIRYIQEMLGHSSINITEIYTHVAMSKQKDILTTKHPRKKFSF